MSTRAHDPWQDRLSEYLDDELGPGERAALEAHLVGCAPCREVLADLRRIAGAARALGPREPARDLWPALAAELEPRRTPRNPVRWPLAFAAGVLVTLVAVLAFLSRGADEPRVAAGESYLLLLHEPEGFGSQLDETQHAAQVERYAAWARGLGERCLGGEELEAGGLELRAGATEPGRSTDGPRIGGYFLLAARDGEEALALARTCPHLDQGGSLELRRIRTR